MAKNKERKPENIENEFYPNTEYVSSDIPWVKENEMEWTRKWWYIGNTDGDPQNYAIMRNIQRPWDFFYDTSTGNIVFRFADWYSKVVT